MDLGSFFLHRRLEELIRCAAEESITWAINYCVPPVLTVDTFDGIFVGLS